MKTDVKKWLTRQSFREIQERLKHHSGRSHTKGWVRFLLYILMAFALIVLLVPDSKHLPKPSVGFDIPNLLSDEHRATYVPDIFDPIRSVSIPMDNSKKLKPDGRFSKIELISLTNFRKIPTGAEANATLVSGGTNGLIKAELSEELRFDGIQYLPARTILMGTGTSSDDRLFISFKKAIGPGGKVLKVSAQGFDFSDRLLGLKGKKISDYAFKIAASSGLIFLGALAESQQSTEGSFLQPRRKSLKDSALDGVATATAEQGKRLIDSMDIQSRVEVKANTNLIVIFEEADDDKR